MKLAPAVRTSYMVILVISCAVAYQETPDDINTPWSGELREKKMAEFLDSSDAERVDALNEYKDKREPPSGFQGMRGKKDVDIRDKKKPSSGFMGMRGKKNPPSGFMGMRGKKNPPSGFMGMRGKKKPSSGFLGMRGKKNPPSGFMGMRGKKNPPSGFMGMRGKKNPPSGFMGMRGKKEISLEDILESLHNADRGYNNGFLNEVMKK